LVEHKTTHEQFALKRVEFQFLTESEQMAAENEVVLLRVLIGPTIIRYYESFVEEGSLYIVMEYAENRCLDSLVKDYKNMGNTFSAEQIYDWIAQIILALMIMHSKNILHRDLKI
jgi:NIMA (never in mitosis gene a)-related kinase